MKETKRIISLFEKLYERSPWIDVNLSGALSEIHAKRASTQVFGKYNYYEHIHGILQHDAYHLGQITLLIKYLN